MEEITAEEILNEIGAKPLSVPPETTIYNAVKLMLEKRETAVLVKKDDKYAGIWTERDVMKDILIEGFDMMTSQVGEFMSSPILSAPHSHTIFQLIDKFLGLDIRHLLIEKNGECIGLLYARDVIRAGLTVRTEELQELDEMVSLEYYENWKWMKKHK